MTPGLLVCQFSIQDALGSDLIAYLSAGYWSHVDLVVPIHERRRYASTTPILTADGLLGARLNGGVQMRPANYSRFVRTLRMGCVVPDIDAAYSFAFAQVGKPYDKGKILDFFLHKFGKPNEFDPNQKSWFCDELVYEIYKMGGVQLLNAANPCNLTPQCVSESPMLKEIA